MYRINFNPIRMYISSLEKYVYSFKETVRKPYFSHIEFLEIINNVQNLICEIKHEIYHQLSTLQTRIPSILLEFIFSYLNEKNYEDRILSLVCKSWNHEKKKILKKKYPYFLQRFKTGCEGMGIACFHNKLFVGSKDEICVYSNNGKKRTTFPVGVTGTIQNLIINHENKKIYVKDYVHPGIKVFSTNGEYERDINYNITKCATQNNKLFVAVPVYEDDHEYMNEQNVLELDMLNGQVLKDWRTEIRVNDLVYDQNEIFFIAGSGSKVEVFSENGKILRSWKIGQPQTGRGICVQTNNVFVSKPTEILTFDRLGNLLFTLTAPNFLLPKMGFYDICIQNNELFVSSEYNNWIYIFQTKNKKCIKKTIEKRKQIILN